MWRVGAAHESEQKGRHGEQQVLELRRDHQLVPERVQRRDQVAPLDELSERAAARRALRERRARRARQHSQVQ